MLSKELEWIAWTKLGQDIDGELALISGRTVCLCLQTVQELPLVMGKSMTEMGFRPCSCL